MGKKDHCGQHTQVRHIFSEKASLRIIFICVSLSQTKLSSLSELARNGILLVQPQTKLGNLLFQLPSISQREILFAFPEISIWISQSFQQDFAALIISLVFPHCSMQGYQDLSFYVCSQTSETHHLNSWSLWSTTQRQTLKKSTY